MILCARAAGLRRLAPALAFAVALGATAGLAALALAATAGPAESAGELPAASVESALVRVLGPQIQQSLPVHGQASPEVEPRIIRLFLPPGVVTALFWLVIVLLAVYLGWPLLRRARAPGEEPHSGAAVTDAALDDLPLPDHELLASRRRYTEAIHVLLLRAIVLLASRLRAVLPDALTSRELLRSFALPPASREDLGRLVWSVELSHFGGRAAGEAEYRDCRECFRRLDEATRSAP